MSEATATPATTVATAPATTAPAAKQPNALQMLESELIGFFKQKEQTITNLHLIDGAIQATQLLITKFRAEVAKAEAEALKLLKEGVAETEALAADAKDKTVAIVEELEKLATEAKTEGEGVVAAIEKKL